jgi:uncharacterized protein (TIGR03067 family)
MKAMLLTKLKSVVALTVAMLVTVGIGAGLLTCGTAAGEQTEANKAEAVALQKPSEVPPAVAPQKDAALGDLDAASAFFGQLAQSDLKDQAVKQAKLDGDKETESLKKEVDALKKEIDALKLGKALDKLQGTWVLASAEQSGRPIPERVIQALNMTLTIKDDRLTLKFARGGTETRTLEGKLSIDPAKQPATMAWLALKPGEKNVMEKGIYSLADDILKVCYGKERPTEFKTKPEPLDQPTQGMFVFKREK